MMTNAGAVLVFSLFAIPILIACFFFYQDKKNRFEKNLFQRSGAIVTIFGIFITIYSNSISEYISEISFKVGKLDEKNIALIDFQIESEFLRIIDKYRQSAIPDNEKQQLMGLISEKLRYSAHSEQENAAEIFSGIAKTGIWIQWAAAIIGVVGTIIWGFGDLIVRRFLKAT